MPSSLSSLVKKKSAAGAPLFLRCLLLPLCGAVPPAAAFDMPPTAPKVAIKPVAAHATALSPPPAPAAPADPMDQLRQRLAERLAAGKAAAIETASSDLRAVARPATAASGTASMAGLPAAKTSAKRPAAPPPSA